MKTLTQAEATPGEWNFISQGLFPEHRQIVLVTVNWNHQEFVMQGMFQRIDEDAWFFDDSQGYLLEGVISWQHQPAPSKKTHKEQWMSQWEWDRPMDIVTHPDLSVFIDMAGPTWFVCRFDNGATISTHISQDDAKEECYKIYLETNP